MQVVTENVHHKPGQFLWEREAASKDKLSVKAVSNRIILLSTNITDFQSTNQIQDPIFKMNFSILNFMLHNLFPGFGGLLSCLG